MTTPSVQLAMLREEEQRKALAVFEYRKSNIYVTRIATFFRIRDLRREVVRSIRKHHRPMW